MAVSALDTPLYNSRIFDSYLRLIRKRYSHVYIPLLLCHAGMKEYEVADFGHWFTQRQVNLFHEKLVDLTGDPSIAREAGRYAASSDALGFLREFLLGLVGPEYLFLVINRVAANFSRSSRCTSRKIGPRRLEMTVTFEDGVREHPNQCLNRIGFIEAVFLLFNRSLPTVEHEECIFKGGKVCRYLINWEASRGSRLDRLQRLSFVLLGASAAVAAPLISNPYLAGLLICALPLHLLVSFLAHNSERKALLASLASMRDSGERLLAQTSELLERRVEERTAELLQAREEIELLYDSVAHDLRTPLRVIYGYGEMLLDSYGDGMDEAARDYVGSMIKGGERMEATLDRMLDYSAVRMAEPRLQPVDLSAMATRILMDLRITDSKREVVTRVQPGVVVTGDEGLLKSVMENLLGNAWKYSAGNELTRISFGRAEGVCYVSDNGAGFDMALADRLFMPFQRLHGGDTFSGHGLGLAMVRRMLERLGGKIWGDGKEGEGATFYFTVSADTLPLHLPSFRSWE